MKLLHIEGSPRGRESVSTRLAEHFIARLGSGRGLEVDRLAVWEEALPPFDGAALAAKYARLGGRELTGEQSAAWSVIAALTERLARADAVLISTPMWNFGVPYRLKHWFDLVTQPGLTFTFQPDRGYAPILPPRPATVILASSGDYSAGPSWGRPDLASGYLSAALTFIGVSPPRTVHAGPTAGPEGPKQAAEAAARRRLDAIAADWGTA